MYKTKSKKRAWCKSIALIPVFIAAICVFSTKIIAQNDLNTLQTNESAGNPVTDNDRMITPGKGVSQELLTEYQTIVDKYFDKETKGNTNESVKLYWKSEYLSEEDWSQLYVIYVQMTDEQKEKQKITFSAGMVGDMSGQTYPPSKKRYDSWIKDQKYHIWIDGKKVDNSVLKSQKTTDFVYSFISSLTRSGKKDEFRVDLWTKTGYENLRQHFFEQPVSVSKLLEIEPDIKFLMEKDNEKYICLWTNPLSGWSLCTTYPAKQTDGVTLAYYMGTATSTPLSYHQNSK